MFYCFFVFNEFPVNIIVLHRKITVRSIFRDFERLLIYHLGYVCLFISLHYHQNDFKILRMNSDHRSRDCYSYAIIESPKLRYNRMPIERGRKFASFFRFFKDVSPSFFYLFSVTKFYRILPTDINKFNQKCHSYHESEAYWSWAFLATYCIWFEWDGPGLRRRFELLNHIQTDLMDHSDV